MDAKPVKDALWRLHGGAPLMWVECGGEYIVFHPDSGETHYLNDFSALVLRCMEDGPVSDCSLCDRLIELLGDDNPGLESQLDSLLTRFDQLGLVEPVERLA